MNIQAEKIELIKLITEIENLPLLKKLHKIITDARPQQGTSAGDAVSPAMTKRLLESRKQIAEGKGAKVSLDEIWK